MELTIKFIIFKTLTVYNPRITCSMKDIKYM